MPDKSHTKLAVIVHENNEITVKEGRGVPVVCRDCRFAGWLTEYEFKNNPLPIRCLYHSGGADPHDGDRVIFDDARQEGATYAKDHWGDRIPDNRSWPKAANGWKLKPLYGHYEKEEKYGKRYPKCSTKNHDGKCKDFVRAKAHPSKPSWWKRFLRIVSWKPFDRREMRH